MECPRCVNSNLSKEIYEGVHIDRCSNCDGAWLDEGEIAMIIAKREKIVPLDKQDKTFLGVPEKELETKIACPHCSRLMKTFNYGVNSGIILDSCPDSKGLWFDKDELEKVQSYREFWEKEAVSRGDKWESLIKSEDLKESSKSENSWSPFKLLINLFYS